MAVKADAENDKVKAAVSRYLIVVALGVLLGRIVKLRNAFFGLKLLIKLMSTAQALVCAYVFADIEYLAAGKVGSLIRGKLGENALKRAPRRKGKAGIGFFGNKLFHH